MSRVLQGPVRLKASYQQLICLSKYIKLKIVENIQVLIYFKNAVHLLSRMLSHIWQENLTKGNGVVHTL